VEISPLSSRFTGWKMIGLHILSLKSMSSTIRPDSEEKYNFFNSDIFSASSLSRSHEYEFELGQVADIPAKVGSNPFHQTG
jgi:hypothetical protein